MSAKFCPKCGNENTPFFKGLCKNCFFEKNSIFELPARIAIEKCRICGRINVFRKWSKENNFLIEKLIQKNAKTRDLYRPEFKVSFFPEEKGIRAKVMVKGKIDSSEIEQEKETLIEFANARCDSCMKAVSNYFEATIQLRFEKKETGEKVLKEIDKMLSDSRAEDLLAKIVSSKKQKSGIDLVLGSNKSASQIAKAIAKKYNAELVVSFKLAKGGLPEKPKKRCTYCLRIS